MMEILCIAAAFAIVSLIVAVALFDWGGALNRWQRRGLLALAGGLAWAGPARFLGEPPSMGDLLFLVGLLTYLCATYGPTLYRKADLLDGTADGKVHVASLAANVVDLKHRR